MFDPAQTGSDIAKLLGKSGRGGGITFLLVPTNLLG